MASFIGVANSFYYSKFPLLFPLPYWIPFIIPFTAMNSFYWRGELLVKPFYLLV